MSGTPCQVDRARVIGGVADDGPRWRFLVEDALRTAEFGDAGRLVLVRRLRLTGLPARPAPGQAARALEAAWAAQARQALPASAPGAPAAGAVWFASRVEACAAWLIAWAEDRDAALAAWFWPAALAVPQDKTRAAPIPAFAAQVWRAAQAAAPRSWTRQVAAWPDRRLAVLARRWALAEVLPAALEAGEARFETDATVAPTDEGDAPATVAERHAVVAVVARLQALPEAHALPRAALAWLAAQWLGTTLVVERARPAVVRAVVDRAAVPAGRAEPPQAPAPSAMAPPPRPRAAADPLPPARRPPRSEAPEVMPTAASPTAETAPPAQARPTARPPRGASASASATVRRTASGPATASPAPWLAAGEDTAHGGLLFLLNLLPRLGFLPWLVAQPDAPVFVDGLFLHLLDVTGAPPEDPQRAELRPGLAPHDPRLRFWRLRLRRALRRRFGLDLTELVQRPAGVQSTPTHLDLVFALDAVDLRLRRAGLDLDPGWVPWFGRIVTFHFL